MSNTNNDKCIIKKYVMNIEKIQYYIYILENTNTILFYLIM